MAEPVRIKIEDEELANAPPPRASAEPLPAIVLDAEPAPPRANAEPLPANAEPLPANAEPLPAIVLDAEPAPPAPAPPVLPCTGLAAVNARLEATGALPEGVWMQWLWQTDPEEALSPSVLLNRCHLLGLLVCRQQARRQQQQAGATGQPPAAAAAAADERMRLMEKRPADMTLRELRDTVDNLLIEWPQFLARLSGNPRARENLLAVVDLLDGCLARFGYLAEHPGPATVFNDGASTEPHDEAGDALRLTRPCMRRALSAFLVMYRHLHLLMVAEEVPPVPYDCGICKHHMEASQDDFHLLCMSHQLPVAARITYKHDFPGMYNHISQVVYFHNAQYERIARIPFSRVGEGDPLHVLPALLQLHPQIDLRYEEDRLDLVNGPGRWVWLAVPGRVYLVAPDGRVLHSPDVTSLLRVYVESRPEPPPAAARAPARRPRGA